MAVWEVVTIDGLTFTGDPAASMVLEAVEMPPPKAKPEWITAADSEWAALARSPLHENREITLRVRIAQQSTMDIALNQIGLIRDKLRKASLTPDGVLATWVPADSTRTTRFDVLHGEITGMPITWDGTDAGWFQRRPVITIVLSAKPYGYGAETLSTTVTNATPLQTIEVANIPGDIPALGRLIVTDAATQNRRFVDWGIENQNYNSATSLLIDSDDMVLTGFGGAGTTLTGAYDPNALGNSAIMVSVPRRPLAVAGTGVQSHVGTFRVWARVVCNSSTHRVRLAWRTGDGPYTTNAWVAAPGGQFDWSEVDLGLITVSPVTLGTQRWDGRIEVWDTGTGAATTFYLDYLTLLPAAEGYGQARAQYQYLSGASLANDEFTGTTAGAVLNARIAPTGGTWATSGAVTDFTFSDAPSGGPPGTEERIQRGTTSDTGAGRFAILGATNYTDTEVGALIWRELTQQVGWTMTLSLVARYVDASNYMVFDFSPLADLRIRTVVAGTTTTITSATVGGLQGGTFYQMRLVVFASGRAIGTLLDTQGNILATVDGTSSALATGGALATGKPGLRDYFFNATPTLLRIYDEFYVSTPGAEPMVVYSNRTLQVRHDTTIRQDSGGTYYGRPPSYRGSRFTVPPGTSRIAVRARRNEITVNPSPAVTDSTTIQVATTPRYLVVPR